MAQWSALPLFIGLLKPNSNCIRVRLQTFAIRQCYDGGTKGLKSRLGYLLGSDVLLEGLGVHATVLTRVAVCW